MLTSSAGASTDTYNFKAFGDHYSFTGSTTNSFRWVGRLGYYYLCDCQLGGAVFSGRFLGRRCSTRRLSAKAVRPCSAKIRCSPGGGVLGAGSPSRRSTCCKVFVFRKRPTGWLVACPEVAALAAVAFSPQEGEGLDLGRACVTGCRFSFSPPARMRSFRSFLLPAELAS